MSKSDFDHGLQLQDKLVTDEELLGHGQEDVSAWTEVDRENVTPFAKKLVENVVLKALGVLEMSHEEGKHWLDVVNSERNSEKNKEPQLEAVLKGSPITAASLQRSVLRVLHMQVQNEADCDAIQAKEVAKLVEGLQDIQIGDSTFVLPANNTKIEKQVKRVVCSINRLNSSDMGTAEFITCDGQGDVHETEILEAEVGLPSASKPQQETTKVSTSILHKMIEELEDADQVKETLEDFRSKEGIAAWEENEETFIQTIEGIKDGDAVPLGNASSSVEDCVQIEECLESILPNFGNDETDGSIGGCSREEGRFPAGDVEKGSDVLRRCSSGSDVDQEPYWSSAGLILRSTPQYVSSDKTQKEPNLVEDEVDVENDQNTSKMIVEVTTEDDVAQKAKAAKEIRKTKMTKKKTFGGKILKLLSIFKRGKEC